MSAEIWLPVPSLPEYLASSFGRIMRTAYSAPMPFGGTRTYGGQPWFGCWDGDRFIMQFRGKSYKIHRMVCEAFHGTAPEDCPNVLHTDENAANNRPENLKLGTQKENLNAPGFLAYCRSRVGDLSPSKKSRAAQKSLTI